MTEPTPEELEDAGVEIFALTEEPIPDESPDRLFVTPSGTRLRARLRKTDERVERSPNAEITDQILPTAMTLTLTLSVLNEDNSMKLINGKYVISEPVGIHIGYHQLENGGFDADAVIMRTITDRARDVENMLEAREHGTGSLVVGNQLGWSPEHRRNIESYSEGD